MTGGSGAGKRCGILFIVGAMLIMATHSGSANAAEPSILWQKCGPGEGGGQCSKPGGMAPDPVTGNLFVVDRLNNRINEFSIWGTFIKAWGWGVADGAPEPEVCGPGASPPTSSCQQGIAGTGPGQFAEARSVAMDSKGDLFVYESITCTGGTGCEAAPHTNRVQKFDQSGNFLLMFGGGVNLTAVAEREDQEANAEPVTITAEEEDICTAASGDVCGPGEQGSGEGEFGTGPLIPIDPEGSFIAVGPGDTVAIGSQERIQLFDDDGSFLKSISLPGIAVRGLAVDGAGNFYVIRADWEAGTAEAVLGDSKSDVVKFSPTGTPLCTATVDDPRAIAVDADGRLYASAGSGESTSIHRFGPTCAEDLGFAFAVTGLEVFNVTTGIATTAACGIDGNVYYANGSVANAFVRAYYPHPDPLACPPPKDPPSITAQWAESVNATSAVVRASINPHFWPDTRYYVQWGTEDCKVSPAACAETELAPGTALNSEDDVSTKTQMVTLSGLSPGTRYYFRFIAESSGGGPVFGTDPDGEGPEEATPEQGAGGAFTTYPLPAPLKQDCVNQPVRLASAERLPDCRAYEMVSPIDKEGGDILSLPNSKGDTAALYQGAASGERMTFSSYRSFGGPRGAPYTSQYLASRTSTGWSSAAISLPQEGPALIEGAFLESSYKGFDEELCSAWVLQLFEPALTTDALSGYSNLYKRENCGAAAGNLEAISRVAPVYEPVVGTVAPLPVAEFLPSFQGASQTGDHTVFRSAGRLVPEAAPCSDTEKADNGNECPRQVYDYHAGQVKLVCVLPSGKAFDSSCSLGNGRALESIALHNNVFHAVSSDGSRIFWSDARSGVGRLFVRVDGEETILISGQPAWYWAASVDGSRVMFNIPDSNVDLTGALVEVDTVTKLKHTVAKKVTGVLGVSDDARRLYFASREALTDEASSAGQLPQEGATNLYFYEAGEPRTFKFIGTLSGADGPLSEVSPLQPDPFSHTARVTSDGLHALFTSTAPLTGVDNSDAMSGEADSQVFLYDAVDDRLRCVSCNPSGARPHGYQAELSRKPIALWAAGSIPGWIDQTHASRVLSDDGERVFFDSSDRLVLSDTNHRRDVYEWEPGGSQAACEEAGAELFLRREGGCISLISSGQSSSHSEFLDAGRSGRDVFFRTASSLVPQDPGLIDVYDAREGGGYPPPPQPPTSCDGDSCQAPAAPTPTTPPPSASFEGSGNAVPRHRACRKGKVRRKGKCVKKHHKHHHQHKSKRSGR